MPRRRSPQHLTISGWICDGPDLLIQCRLTVKTVSGKWQAVGPVYSLGIPFEELATSEVSDHLETAWQRIRIRERAEFLASVARDQPPLF